jgi:hypothetical protein
MTREKKRDLREQSHLMEFTKYRDSRKKQLTKFSLEVIRAGFKKCWVERDYASIIVVARKLPEEVLLGDTLLCMWYDNAVLRSGGPLALTIW